MYSGSVMYEGEQVTFDELLDVHNTTYLSDGLHLNDAGYDIINNLDGVLEEFDKIIGLDRLKAIHINDSMNERGAAKDRHQKIGDGTIGVDAFERIINHPKLRELPFFLETPNELDGYAKEIKLLKSLYKN